MTLLVVWSQRPVAGGLCQRAVGAVNLDARIPETALILLIIGAALTLGIVGYSAGLTRRRSLLGASVLVFVLAAVLTLVVDLDRPRDGFLQVSQQPLIDLQDQIGAPPS